MSYPVGLKDEALRALGAIHESPELATWRDWCAVGAVALILVPLLILAFWLAGGALYF